MRVLFILKQMGYVRHFDTIIEALAARGHMVRVASQDGEHGLPEALAGNPRISARPCTKKRGDEWRDYASLIRRAGDYVRYLEPVYADTVKLRARAFDRLVSTLSRDTRSPGAAWSEVGLGLTAPERARLRQLFGLIEDAIPSDRQLEAFLQAEAPDVILLTPLIDLGSGQTDFVKSARALGIPIGMVLFSWDNLSTKGGVHVVPDRLFVWNELQKQEAIELHDVTADRIVVTGAPRFDRFFAMSPVTSRVEFCAALGFDPDKPIVVYLGSSKFVSEDERRFIGQWIETLRRAEEPRLRECNILVKPHPDLNREWEGDRATTIRWEGMGSLRVPLTVPFPFERVAVVRSTFTAAQFLYDCLYHSAGVVGLNTSAELEAGILGKPVCTIRVDSRVADGQASTLHFHYLLQERGGFVRTAAGLDEHRRQLADALAGRYDAARIREFIGRFLRPAGLDVPATDVLVRAVEGDLARLHPDPARPSAGRTADGRGPAVRGKVLDRRAPSGAVAADGPERPRVRLDYEPEPIWLCATSPMERKWRARTCAKEPWTVAWIERYLREGDVLYDIGANVGAFSLIAAKRYRNRVTVVAFEPGYASFAHLCDNIVLNGCDRSIIPISLPLSAQTGLAGFKYRSLHPGQSRHRLIDAPPRRPKDKAETTYRQPVLAMRLDDLIRQFELPLPNHIKLDVDGAELGVLEGAGAVVTHPGLRTMLVEIDRAFGERVCTLLCREGFSLAARYEREDKPHAPWYGLFARPGVSVAAR